MRIRIKNEFVDDRPKLMGGMFAEATLAIGEPVKTRLVPKDAIVLGGKRTVVYVVEGVDSQTGAGTAREVPVTTGVAYGALIEIRGMVEPGNLVVVRGNERLRPQQEVMITDHFKTDLLVEMAGTSR